MLVIQRVSYATPLPATISLSTAQWVLPCVGGQTASGRSGSSRVTGVPDNPLRGNPLCVSARAKVRWHGAESFWMEALAIGSCRGHHRPSVFDPKRVFTTDRYPVVHSNDGIIGVDLKGVNVPTTPTTPLSKSPSELPPNVGQFLKVLDLCSCGSTTQTL